MTASKEADQLDQGQQIEDSDQAVDDGPSAADQAVDLQAELEQAQAKAQQHWEELLRAKAEMDNIRKRAVRDIEAARRFGLETCMTDLLEVNDSLERGLEAAQGEDVGVEQLREGTDLTLKLLQKVMSKHGLIEIDPAGQKFDPERHEAMTIVPTEDQEPDTVVAVIQKGYVLNDRLLRPARVMVASKPE